MPVVHATIRIAPDGTISGHAPREVPPGEYQAPRCLRRRPSDAARQALERHSEGPERLRISRQILREYLAVVTRPQLFTSPISIAEALADVVRFADIFEILEDGPAVGAQLLDLCRSVALAGRQVHDANIVATMLAHGENRLLPRTAAISSAFSPGSRSSTCELNGWLAPARRSPQGRPCCSVQAVDLVERSLPWLA